MTKEQKIYKKLPGKRRLPLWTNSLWLGPDHLLSVDSKTVSEDYKRFYYRDIQAIIIRKIDHWKTINIVLGSICGIFFLLMLLKDGGWSIFFGIMWGLFFLPFLYYLILGATCETHIKTAVQIERLPALYRLRRSGRAMNLLFQRIENAQGRLSRETMMQTRDERPQEPFKIRPHVDYIHAEPVKEENGLFHTILYILLSLYGIQIVADIFYNHIAFPITGTLFSLFICAFTIMALVRQHNSTLPDQLKKTTWASLVFIIFDFIVSIVLSFYMMMSVLFEETPAVNQWDMMKMAAEFSPFEHPFVLTIYMVTASGALVLGVLGMHFIVKTRAPQEKTYSK